MPHPLARRLAATGLLALVAQGCNLNFDLDDYPFEPAIVIEDVGRDAGPDMAPPEDAGPPDLGPPDMPVVEKTHQLLFSEVLINTNFENDQTAEVGEFFEIVNVGDGEATMAFVTIRFSDPDDANFASMWTVGVPSSVKLPTDGLFVVHKKDFGTWFETNIPSTRRFDVTNATGLSNGEFRRAELVYDGEVHDTLYWRSGNLRLCSSGGDILACPLDDVVTIDGQENKSFELRPTFQSPESSKKIDAWCLAARPFQPPVNNDLAGSPGTVNPDQCS